MKVLLYFLIVIHATLQACIDLEQQATVQIQNFECPIYVHPPPCNQRHQETYEYECTCVKQPSYSPGVYNTGTYLGIDKKCPTDIYNTGTYLGVDKKCPTDVYNTGTYLGSYYPQTGVDQFCQTDVKKSCPRKVEIDTTLMYGLPQNYQNRQCEVKYAYY
ncbi:uncharacterized protein LOC132903371 [Amyelois transitella]|uniref:uncharacterized protein LOC132903371 n=1 Tax=Amyelois transitella TaxID=680683 RepID=UPI00298FB022|nr:uncharacterized protein LOC132903371 [Amyelois transitella]